MQHLTIRKPDDWHLHLRDGEALRDTIGTTARYAARAIVMPNLVPPVNSIALANSYYGRIREHAGERGFEPLMTLYLTDQITPELIRAASSTDFIHACKLYPAGATTNSASGVTRIENILPALETMAEVGMVLCIHGEVTNADVDIFDRERVFIDRTLAPLIKRLPTLRVVLEHITTSDAVAFVNDANRNSEEIRLAATITPHHLMFNRNDMLVGGIRPHYYCLPILKRATHREALRQAAVSRQPWFFLGTDSAPHETGKKEAVCGCAGCYNAPVAIELYAQVFEELGALDALQGFASEFGPAFYQLAPNEDMITLIKDPWQVPERLPLGDGWARPLMAGEIIHWKMAE